MSAPLQTTLRTVLLPFATALALACGVAHAAPAQEDNGVNVLHAAQSLYVGDVGQGNEVLLVLKPAGGRKLAGSYHYARGWSQDELALAGDAINQQVVLRETLITEQGKHSRSGVFRGQISADGSTITGTWISTDGRRKLPLHAHPRRHLEHAIRSRRRRGAQLRAAALCRHPLRAAEPRTGGSLRLFPGRWP